MVLVRLIVRAVQQAVSVVLRMLLLGGFNYTYRLNLSTYTNANLNKIGNHVKQVSFRR